MAEQTSSNKKMNKMKIDWALILGVIGALAWMPYLIETLLPNKIEGKLISVYGNMGEFSGKPATLMLLKLAIISKNHNFDLKDLNLRIKFGKTGWKEANVVNSRVMYFTFDDGTKKLNLKNDDFINNLIQLPKDESMAGYIGCFIPEIIDEEVNEIELSFISFSGNSKILKIDKSRIPTHKLSFDDSIWEKIDLIPAKLKTN